MSQSIKINLRVAIAIYNKYLKNMSWVMYTAVMSHGLGNDRGIIAMMQNFCLSVSNTRILRVSE